MRTGTIVMALFAIAGNIPLVEGADILKATTLSGTMVLGLAPVFLLERLVGYSPASFHFSFWTGIAVGVLLTFGQWPDFLSIGTGAHADLLGANLYGLLLCSAGYLAPALLATLSPAPLHAPADRSVAVEERDEGMEPRDAGA
jgi:hypothetical protein